MFYALIEIGEYEETRVEIYKLDKIDKYKLIEFCNLSKDLIYDEQLRLISFCENIELIDGDYLNYNIKNINDLLEEVSDNYKWTIKLDDLEEDKDLILSTYEKLLSYKFVEIK